MISAGSVSTTIRQVNHSAVPRQQHLIVTVFGIFCRAENAAIAVADLISLLADCGVESSAVRSAVSRLKKRGLLESQRQGRSTVYAPSAALRSVFQEGDAHIFDPPRAALDDRWLLAAFTVPESHRHLRHRIRSIFAKRGAGSVTPGVWIVPSLNTERICAELGHENLLDYVEFFAADYLGPEQLAEKVASWWDLAALAGLYDGFVTNWRPVLQQDVQDSPARAFSQYVLLMTQWRRLPYLDPGLPLEALPQPWPAEDASQLMRALHARLGPAARAHVENVTGQPVTATFG